MDLHSFSRPICKKELGSILFCCSIRFIFIKPVCVSNADNTCVYLTVSDQHLCFCMQYTEGL